MLRNANRSRINRAHLTKARNIHPDRMGDQSKHPDVLEAIQRLNNAADVLKDPMARNIYDTAQSADEFVRGMQQHSAKQAKTRQNEEAEESRARAQAAAEQHARERTAERRATGPWYQEYHGKTTERIAKRIREHKPKAGLDGNTFTPADSTAAHQDERIKEQAKRRAERQIAARERA